MDTVDSQNPAPVEVGSLSQYLEGLSYTSHVVQDSSINSREQFL